MVSVFFDNFVLVLILRFSSFGVVILSSLLKLKHSPVCHKMAMMGWRREAESEWQSPVINCVRIALADCPWADRVDGRSAVETDDGGG